MIFRPRATGRRIAHTWSRSMNYLFYLSKKKLHFFNVAHAVVMVSAYYQSKSNGMCGGVFSNTLFIWVRAHLFYARLLPACVRIIVINMCVCVCVCFGACASVFLRPCSRPATTHARSMRFGCDDCPARHESKLRRVRKRSTRDDACMCVCTVCFAYMRIFVVCTKKGAKPGHGAVLRCVVRRPHANYMGDWCQIAEYKNRVYRLKRSERLSNA